MTTESPAKSRISGKEATQVAVDMASRGNRFREYKRLGSIIRAARARSGIDGGVDGDKLEVLQ